jgi:hypothetical protein
MRDSTCVISGAHPNIQSAGVTVSSISFVSDVVRELDLGLIGKHHMVRRFQQTISLSVHTVSPERCEVSTQSNAKIAQVLGSKRFNMYAKTRYKLSSG